MRNRPSNVIKVAIWFARMKKKLSMLMTMKECRKVDRWRTRCQSTAENRNRPFLYPPPCRCTYRARFYRCLSHGKFTYYRIQHRDSSSCVSCPICRNLRLSNPIVQHVRSRDRRPKRCVVDRPFLLVSWHAHNGVRSSSASSVAGLLRSLPHDSIYELHSKSKAIGQLLVSKTFQYVHVENEVPSIVPAVRYVSHPVRSSLLFLYSSETQQIYLDPNESFRLLRFC